jgi:hypothetical protein
MVLLLAALVGVSCSARSPDPFLEIFDQTGNWGVGSSPEVEGSVADGVYDMLVKDERGIYLATAGLQYADGVYQLEATQVAGPLNAGFGLLYRLDEASDSFYAFQISADGYVWIGRCQDLCQGEDQPLVGRGWYPSPAVRTGLQVKNHLRVVAKGSEMTFFVNDEQVGRTVDERLERGDIALVVETLGQGGVQVAFDNFEFSSQIPG